MDAKDMTLDELIKRDKKLGRGGARGGRGGARGGRGHTSGRFGDRGSSRPPFSGRGFRGAPV